MFLHCLFSQFWSYIVLEWEEIVQSSHPRVAMQVLQMQLHHYWQITKALALVIFFFWLEKSWLWPCLKRVPNVLECFQIFNFSVTPKTLIKTCPHPFKTSVQPYWRDECTRLYFINQKINFKLPRLPLPALSLHFCIVKPPFFHFVQKEWPDSPFPTTGHRHRWQSPCWILSPPDKPGTRRRWAPRSRCTRQSPVPAACTNTKLTQLNSHCMNIWTFSSRCL